MSLRRLALPVLSLSVACGGGGGKPAPTPLPALSAAPLVTERTIQLVHPIEIETALVPADVAGLKQLLAQGWGETTMGAAEAIAPHTLDGSAPPAASASPTLLVRFAHLADTQLADDESPARVVDFANMGATYAAYRPQEAWGCRMLNAAVRTLDKVHEAHPLEFVLLGGDNADNVQSNEQDWFHAILDGSPSVECDSGDDDDPVPGPDNDPKDPFVAQGLTMPWRWVTGNHDVLNQGNFRLGSELSSYTGTDAPFSTRDWSRPGGPSTKGPVIADPRRAPLDRMALMAKIASDADGHGITAAAQAAGKAYYHFDVASGRVRIMVVDSAAETGAADGVIHRGDLEAFVRPALEEAEAEGKYVIVVSHHSAPTLTNGAGPGGAIQDDAVLTDEWRSFLGGFPHVMLHLGAHTHLFRSTAVKPTTGHSYFEAETASLADWPGEVRLFEVWEEAAHIVIRAIPVDYATEGDPVVAEARTRAAADFTSGWVDPSVGPGPEDSRAIELWFPKAP